MSTATKYPHCHRQHRREGRRGGEGEEEEKLADKHYFQLVLYACTCICTLHCMEQVSLACINSTLLLNIVGASWVSADTHPTGFDCVFSEPDS